VEKDKTGLIGITIILCIISSIFSGCLEQDNNSDESPIIAHQDQPSILPSWNDGDYHDYYGTTQKLLELNEKYPNLASIFSIGKSVLRKEIWCIKITNEENNSHKLSCLIDGCIHGFEWEAGEACLYLAEYLLINFCINESITRILNTTEVYIVPLVNPDGRQNDEANNANGVDLNRNFDVFYGKLRSPCIRLGKRLSKIIGPAIKIPFLPISKWPRNSGRYAFSEPESKALASLMNTLGTQDFSFYVNCHTAWHNIITPVPWSKTIVNPPYIMTKKEIQLFEDVKDWVEKNTEYETDKSEETSVGGCADIWAFNEFRIPSFTFEILSLDYDPWIEEKKHDNLVHWMDTTLPFFMYLLVNIENLHNWEIPNVEPLLPEGVPPPPLQ